MLSILTGSLLIVLSLFAIGIAFWALQIGQGLVSVGSIALMVLPRWVRWLILLPAIILFTFILIFTFNVLHWIGDWFGASFVRTAWIWCLTFIQAVILPRMLVTAACIIAPNGRRWIAIATMLAIWVWCFGALLEPDTGEFLDFEFGFHGFLLVAALSAAWSVIHMRTINRLMEAEDPRGHVSESWYCETCGNKLSEEVSFCSSCGASVRTDQGS